MIHQFRCPPLSALIALYIIHNTQHSIVLRRVSLRPVNRRCDLNKTKKQQEQQEQQRQQANKETKPHERTMSKRVSPRPPRLMLLEVILARCSCSDIYCGRMCSGLEAAAKAGFGSVDISLGLFNNVIKLARSWEPLLQPSGSSRCECGADSAKRYELRRCHG